VELTANCFLGRGGKQRWNNRTLRLKKDQTPRKFQTPQISPEQRGRREKRGGEITTKSGGGRDKRSGGSLESDLGPEERGNIPRVKL